MAIVDDWRKKHPRNSGKGRLILYIFLLLFIIFLILKADTFVRGFADIFFSPDSSSETEVIYPE